MHPRQAALCLPGAAGGAWGPRHASKAPWAQRSAGGTRRPACHPPLPTLKPSCSGDASTSAPLGGSQEETGISNKALESLDSGCPGDGLRPPAARLAPGSGPVLFTNLDGQGVSWFCGERFRDTGDPGCLRQSGFSISDPGAPFGTRLLGEPCKRMLGHSSCVSPSSAHAFGSEGPGAKPWLVSQLCDLGCLAHLL